MKRNKLLLLLALLLTAATGAWAEEKMVTINSGTMSSGAVTATGFGKIGDILYVGQDPATITTSEGVITKLVIKKGVTYVAAFTEANVGVTPGTITYGSDEITVTDINAESVTLSRKGDNNWSPSSIDVYYGTPAGYTVSMKDDVKDAEKWTVKVGEGQAQALPIGGLKGETVTVTYTGTKKVIGVKAEKKAATVPVTAITLNKTETSIKVGATETLSVTSVLPEEATDKTYTWKTSDESKATVDQDGKVTAVAEGTVTIYAEANDGSGVKGNCTVTVTSAVPEYYNKLTKINDSFNDQVNVLKQLGRGRQAYNSSLTAAQAYALATYQAAIDGRPVYVIMSSLDDGYEIHYAVSTDASATEHTADLYDLCSASNTVRMYYVAQ